MVHARISLAARLKGRKDSAGAPGGLRSISPQAPEEARLSGLDSPANARRLKSGRSREWRRTGCRRSLFSTPSETEGPMDARCVSERPEARQGASNAAASGVRGAGCGESACPELGAQGANGALQLLLMVPLLQAAQRRRGRRCCRQSADCAWTPRRPTHVTTTAAESSYCSPKPC